jgi:RNA polymerase sigma-70 factor (ECF subfamily)
MAYAMVMGDDPSSARRGVDREIDLAEERRLVERARTDRSAFAALYRQHVRAVYGFAYRRCGSRDVAEEATSAAFERALRALPSFEWRDTGLRPWLYRIVSNEVTEIYRRRARASGPRGQVALQALTPDDRLAEQAHGHDDEAIDPTVLHRALDRLPERYRDVITLRYLAGLTPQEASIELGWSKSVVAVTLHRALNALRSAVEAEAADGSVAGSSPEGRSARAGNDRRSHHHGNTTRGGAR